MREHGLDQVLQVCVVRPQNGPQERRIDGVLRRVRLERGDILHQTGSAERQPRPEVRRGRIQFGVGAEQRHHLERVDPDGQSRSRDLVGERHLQRVPRVVHQLQHLGGRGIGAAEAVPICGVEHLEEALGPVVITCVHDELG